MGVNDAEAEEVEERDGCGLKDAAGVNEGSAEADADAVVEGLGFIVRLDDLVAVSEGCAEGVWLGAGEVDADAEEVAERVGHVLADADTESLPLPEVDGLTVGVGATVGGPVGTPEGLAVADGDML